MNTPVDASVKIPGYQLTEQLYAGSRTVVYRGIRELDQQPVVIKFLNREYPTFSELLQFQNQYTITKNLNFFGIVCPLNLEVYRNGYALVMADFGGISLREYLTNQQLSVQEFLIIAMQMCDILHYLYQNRVIHKDIKPANILINPKTQEIKLIDFSIASLLPKETQTLISPNILEGTLAYLSPEQTGRMNRGIDYRSDFYSLGVTFFELLTGQLPFTCEDPMELVHCHIAKLPNDVKKAEIPQVLSDIVMKLMAKNAEDRYQSALGLKHDLDICLSQLQETGKIVNFEIGQRDICDRFIIPDKLYGRETEAATLLQAFERVSQGTTEMMLVAGFSGIGKTAVINEVHKPIVRQRGYFIKGKYDQFQRNIPLSAFVQAFRDLIGQLLTENDTQIQQWKSKILDALGESGQIIIEFIPELEQIIGQQPPAPELSGTSAQNRFNLLFQKFTQVFTSVEHPLVIFLDDLQWADSASLKLMQLLMAEIKYLFIIGAYRDREVTPEHPLMFTLSELQKTEAKINTIYLAPLNQIQVNQLVADTLKCPENLAWTLSNLVFQKTQGNPFFATQFLKALHQDKLIKFTPPTRASQGGWECDITQVTQQAVTDDVVAFMVWQIQKLPQSTQHILQLAACIGNQFDLATLAIISEQSEGEVADILWQALQERIILPIGDVYKFYHQESYIISHFLINVQQNFKNQGQSIVAYKFLHDRLQQAAYSLIPDLQRTATHLKIGKLLLQKTPQSERKNHIFALVNQLNYGTELLTLESEKYELAELNLIAAQKAKTSAAYEVALRYVEVGLGLLTANSWQHQYALTLALYELAAETAYLNGDFSQMEELIDVVLQQARTAVEKMKVYAVKIQADMAQVKKLEAVKIGLKALELVGVNLPELPNASDIQQALIQTAKNLEEKNINDLIQLPFMTDIEKQASVKMLASMLTPTYQAAPTLFPLLVCEMVNLSMQYGNSPFSSYGYACYGNIVNAVFQNVDLGYQFGNLALNIADKFNVTDIKASVFLTVGSATIHIKVHLKETLPILIDSYQCGVESGNFEFSGYSGVLKSINSYFIGQELRLLEPEIATMSHALARLNQENTLTVNQIFHQSVLNLLNSSENPSSLQGEVYKEKENLTKLKDTNDRTTLHYLYLNKLILCYLFGESQQAGEYALLAEQYLDGVQGLSAVPLFYFYDSLTSLALYQSESNSQQEYCWSRVSNNQEKMKQMAIYAPMNFQHKFDLVAAEQQRILGNKADAMDLYDRAIAGAKENGYIQEQAIANELAAKFYLAWGKETVAQAYMHQAYYCYAHWGAKAKIDYLEKYYFQLLQLILQQRRLNLNSQETITSATVTHYPSQTSSSSNNSSFSTTLDFDTILKASRALSSAIHLEELITNLMQVLLQNSGAQKIALILPNQADWVVASVATIDELESSSFTSHSLDSSNDVPIKIIYAVKHTRQPIIIHDITKETTWAADSYILQYLPKSVVCTPIVNQGKLIGVLYLENSLTTEVFTSDRIEILNLLCAQAAISLENAHLYAQAQEKSQALQQSEKRYRFLATATSQIIWLANLAGENTDTVHWREYTGQTEAEVQGTGWLNAIHPDDLQHTTQDWTRAVQTKSLYKTEYRIRGADGKYRYFAVRGVPILAEDGSIYEWIGTCTDINDRKHAELALEQKSLELEQALHNLQNAQLQIVQSEKMSALGNLVAGVAHEMNNPLGFIAASLKQVKPTFADIFEHLKIYQENLPNPSDKIIDHAEEIDLEYILEDLPKIIDSMVIACDRLKNISTSLRTFSRADQDYKVPFHIHEGIDSTILILKHRLKANEQRPAIEVITDYGNIQPIDCFPGQINQVLMNILANAIDALDDANFGRNFEEIKLNPNQITIKTYMEQNQLKILIADNGKGMSSEVKSKIFDHLFTTKPVGKGTGLGLAIARQIVVENHSGSIEATSILGQGTEFLITLPGKI